MVKRLIRHINSVLSSPFRGLGGLRDFLSSPFRGLGGLLLLLTVVPALSLGNQPRVGTSPWRVPQSIAKVGTLFLASPEAGESGEDAVDAKNSVPTLSAPAPAATSPSSTSEPQSGAQLPTSQPSATTTTRAGDNGDNEITEYEVSFNDGLVVWEGEYEFKDGWTFEFSINKSVFERYVPNNDAKITFYTREVKEYGDNKLTLSYDNSWGDDKVIAEPEIYYDEDNNKCRDYVYELTESEVNNLKNGLWLLMYNKKLYKITYSATESTGNGEKEEPGTRDDPNNPGGDDDDKTQNVGDFDEDGNLIMWIDKSNETEKLDFMSLSPYIPAEGTLKVYVDGTYSWGGVKMYFHCITSWGEWDQDVTTENHQTSDGQLVYIYDLKEGDYVLGQFNLSTLFNHEIWFKASEGRSIYKITFTAERDLDKGPVNISSAEQYIKFVSDYNTGIVYAKNVTVNLLNDIDFSGFSNIAALGNNDVTFQGAFSGNGHKISNLQINNADDANVGLFGVVDGANISNLIIDNTCSFTGSGSSLIANVTGSGTVISNVVCNATISGDNSAGFVANDESSDLKINNCVYAGEISGSNAAAFVASTSNAKVSNSFALPSSYVKFMGEGTAENCYSSGSSMNGLTAIKTNSRGAHIIEKNGETIPVSSWRFVSLLSPSQDDDTREWHYDIDSDFTYPIPFNKLKPIPFPAKESMKISTVEEYKAFVEEFNYDDSIYETDMDVILASDLTFADSDIVAPLGTASRPYSGTFDGRGFTISNLKIDESSSEKNYVGMFGVLDGATIKNLAVDRNCHFSGNSSSYVGLIGYIKNKVTSIENVVCQTSISGGTAAGLIAKNESQNLTIDNCVYAEGSITGSNKYCAIIADNTGYLKISNSFVILDSPMAFVAGNGEASNCYAYNLSTEMAGVTAITTNSSNEYVVFKDGTDILVASWDFSRLLDNGEIGYSRIWKYDYVSALLKGSDYKYPIPFNRLNYLDDPTRERKKEWLITNHSQLKTNSTSDVYLIGLSDGDAEKDASLDANEASVGGSSTSPWSNGGDDYIQIDLGYGIGLLDDEDLVAYTKRHTNDNVDHPTGVCIVGGYYNTTEGDWQEALKHSENVNAEVVAYAYFLFRGNGGTNGTKEYSERLDLGKEIRDHFNGTGADGKRYTQLRVYFIENNTKANDAYKLASFNIMKLGKEDNYSDILIDRFHLTTDYSKKYFEYKFIPTLGIFDPHNQFAGEIVSEYNTTGVYKNMLGYSDFSGDGNPWEKDKDEYGNDYYKWVKDLDWIEPAGIEIPQYKFLTAKDDSRIINCESSPYEDKENVRQPVHENEHIIYAIPGDPVVLYPFYKINTVVDYNKYAIAFTHWYDYRTGGSSKFLDFLIDPNNVHKSDKYGFFGGEYFTENKDWKFGTVATFFYPRPTVANSLGIIDNLYDINVINDDSESDFIIAADLACIFPKEANVIDTEKSIYEPPITFRHIFRIKDGRVFAEEFSGSAEKNEEYINRHRRIISAPCSKKFQIRLDDPVVTINNVAKTASMNTYYKAGDNDYRRVVKCDIEVERLNDNGEIIETCESNLFAFDTNHNFENQSKRSFEDTEYQFYDNGAQYARMLIWNSSDLSAANRYLVRLIGKDANDNRITVYGSAKDLVVAEFDITFLPDNITNYQTISKNYYDSSNVSISDEDYALFKEDEDNEQKYGNPLTIDFDRYRYATWTNDNSEVTNGVENIEDYIVGDANCGYFKWPLPWDVSTYGFPYSIGLFTKSYGMVEKLDNHVDYNYNVYSLVNSTSAVTYREGMSFGVKDIRFLRTLYQYQKNNSDNIESYQQDPGFFYWVNAADDPGQAARIRLDELCTGSTIYVTGWLMDTSGKDQLCNMVFNLVAIREDGVKETIHSFATGAIAAGNWTKIHYEFTPNYTRIQRIMAESPIDHYELELESNSEGSEGADYALDEIRMYVAKPTVEAEQMKKLCGREKTTDVKISMPYEPLMSYLGLSESTSRSTDAEDASQKSKSHNSPYYSPTQRVAGDGDEIKVYYTFLDVDIFNKYYRTQGYQVAFEKAQLEFDYDGSNDGNTEKYSTLTFNSDYSKIPDFGKFDESNPSYSTVYSYLDENNVRYVSFVAKPEAIGSEDDERNYLTPGHKYIIGIILSDGTIVDPDALDFDIMNSCSHVAEFEVQSANDVNVFLNGTEESKEGSFCLGSTPEVDVNLTATSSSGLTLNLNSSENFFDWYAGTADEFEKAYKVLARNPETGTVTERLYLQDALAQFRNVYVDAKSAENLAPSEDGNLTQTMIDYIMELTEKKHKDGRRMLVLYQQEYKFRPLVSSIGDSINVVTAIPIAKTAYENKTIGDLYYAGILQMSETDFANLNDEQKKDVVTVCLSPIEVQLKVSGNAPSMFHGFDDIKYPSEISSVPIRIGLRQIQETWGYNGSETQTGSGSEDTSKKKYKTLCIPIKTFSAPSELATGLKLGHPAVDTSSSSAGESTDTSDSSDEQTDYNDQHGVIEYYTDGWLSGEPLYLIESDDPNFDQNDTYPIVGQVLYMKADKKSGTEHNAFYVRFDGLGGLEQNPTNYFDFREGYTYTMKFDIQEKGNSLNPYSCPGQHVFTIKVVPEYVKWNGGFQSWFKNDDLVNDETTEQNDGLTGVSRNWNNDSNWLRVSPEELVPSSDANDVKKVLGYGTEVDAMGTAIADHFAKTGKTSPVSTNYESDEDKPNFVNSFTVGGTNGNPTAFTPMEFTKVIVAPGVPFPGMYDVTDTKTSDGDWSQLTKFETKVDPMSGKKYESETNLFWEGEGLSGAGDHGHNIHYDMMVTASNDGVTALTTRPWYANTAKFVHFKPDTEIGGQAYLRTDKVWVDMEISSQGWYTVASPLQSVYAGDMYLPTDGARQVSPLFEGIEFKKKYDFTSGTLVGEGVNEIINHRFKPAVYQRSWNLAEDIVYEIDGSDRDVFRAINWSHVYNDVKVNYAAGEGFSIKADVSAAKNVKEDGKVLFRFPKEDKQYTYYDYNDQTDYKGNDKGILIDPVVKDEKAHGQLNPMKGTIKIKANGNSKFFLVGNPFMSHLNMQEFLSANKEKIQPKYWIVNSNKQSAFILEDGGDKMTTDYTTEIYLPPMSGFFVEAINNVDELILDYTEDMSMVYLNAGKNWLTNGMTPLESDNADRETPSEGGEQGEGETRSGASDKPGVIRISAGQDGWRYSSAVIRVGERFSSGFVHSEDAELLVDPNIQNRSLVYTIGDGNALSINSTPDAYGTEIGVFANGDARTMLLFEGVELDHGYTLYDALTGKVHDLYDGFRYEVEGAVASRLFLADAPTVEEITGLRIESAGHEVSVIPAAPEMEVQVTVCDIAGIVVKDFTAKGATTFRLDDGTYVVTATAADGSAAHAKLLIR